MGLALRLVHPVRIVGRVHGAVCAMPCALPVLVPRQPASEQPEEDLRQAVPYACVHHGYLQVQSGVACAVRVAMGVMPK